MESNNVLKRKTQHHGEGDSKVVKINNIFSSSKDDIDKEDEPVVMDTPEIKLTPDQNVGSDEDDDQEPDPGEIVLSLDSLRKFKQVVDPSFNLDEIESRDRLDSQAAYDRALVARSQQRRLPGKVAKLVDEGKVSQSRPNLSVGVGSYGRSQSYGGRQLSRTEYAEEQLKALTPDERQREIIAKLGVQSNNPLAGLARALKHGPRRSFGKSRHQDGDFSPKQSPVTKPKPKPKVAAKPGSDEKEEKSGGFLFRRRSFNDKKEGEDAKSSPKVGKKFGIKLGSGGSSSKKPVISKPKQNFSSVSEFGENDSVLSVGSSIVSETVATTPSKSFEREPGSQKTSTPQSKESSLPPSRRERTPGAADSSLFNDPPPLFGHRSVLFGSAEFDAIFGKYSGGDGPPGEAKSSPRSEKPSPAKKPVVLPKSSRKVQNGGDTKAASSRVLESRAMFEKQAQKKPPSSPLLGRRSSKEKSPLAKKGSSSKAATEEPVEPPTTEPVKPEHDTKKKGAVEILLFDTPVLKTEAKESDAAKKSPFQDYEVNSKQGKEELFGDDDATGVSKATVYDKLFSIEEPSARMQRSGSLFDDLPGSNDELFRTPKKSAVEKIKDADIEILELSKSPGDHLANVDKDEEEKTSPLLDSGSPFGKEKFPVPSADLVSKEENTAPTGEKMVDQEEPISTPPQVESKAKSPDKDLSPLFTEMPPLHREESLFEMKKSKSEEDLFQMGTKEDEDKASEPLLSGDFILVDADKEAEKKANSSVLFDDDLIFDDSQEVKKLEKQIRKGSLDDEFVMVSTSDVPVDVVLVEEASYDPLGGTTIASSKEVDLEEFPPKQSPKDAETEKESDDPEDSIKTPKLADMARQNSSEKVQAAVEKKKNTPSKEEKKPPAADKPSWAVGLQRRKELKVEKAVTEESKSGTKEQPEPSSVGVKLKTTTAAATLGAADNKKTAKAAATEDDMPEWQKKLMERKQRLAEQKKSIESSTRSSASASTYVSRRQREREEEAAAKAEKLKAEKLEAEMAAKDNEQKNNEHKDDMLKEKEENHLEKEVPNVEEENHVEKEVVEQQDERQTPEFKSKPPSPDKPPLSPKPVLASPVKTSFPSTKPPVAIKKRPPVGVVTVSSTKREPLRSSSEQAGSDDNAETEPRKTESPVGKDKTTTVAPASTKALSVNTAAKKTDTKATISSTTEPSLPKWKQDLLQQKKVAPASPKSRRASSSQQQQQDEEVPKWKRQLLEKKRQLQRTPTPTSDGDRELSPVKTDKPAAATEKPNYRSVLTTTTRSTVSPKVTPSSSTRKATANKDVPEFMKEFKLKSKNSQRESKS